MLGNLPRAGGLALCRGGSRVDAGMHRFLVQQRGAAQRRRDPSAEANEDDGQFGWWPGLEGDAYRQRLKTFSVLCATLSSCSRYRARLRSLQFRQATKRRLIEHAGCACRWSHR